MESGGFLGRRVDIGRNLRLVDLSRFLGYVDFGRDFRLVGPSRFSRL